MNPLSRLLNKSSHCASMPLCLSPLCLILWT